MFFPKIKIKQAATNRQYPERYSIKRCWKLSHQLLISSVIDFYWTSSSSEHRCDVIMKWKTSVQGCCCCYHSRRPYMLGTSFFVQSNKCRFKIAILSVKFFVTMLTTTLRHPDYGGDRKQDDTMENVKS